MRVKFTRKKKLQMKNRFDLEDEISQLYSFSDQLGTISEGILEYGVSTDETVNAIEGLRVIVKLHAQKLHDTMCQCFELDNYRSTKTPSYSPADLLG
jgi:hypothetical protein